MNKSRTTPYHPQSDGITERFNRTLLSMLGTFDPSKKADWRAEVAPLVHAYNCTRHDTTGFSPYLLMFGRQPKIALDVVLGLVNDEHEEVDYGKYMATMRSRLKQAHEQASKNMMSSQERQSRNYNKRARAASLDVGNQVLVKVVSFDGKHKIADKWEEVPYIVMDQPYADIPVYAVQKENRSGPRRTLHRNLLLPISHLPVAEIQKRSTITSHKGPLPSTQEEDPTESIAEDSDEEYLVEEIVNSHEHAHVPTADSVAELENHNEYQESSSDDGTAHTEAAVEHVIAPDPDETSSTSSAHAEELQVVEDADDIVAAPVQVPPQPIPAVRQVRTPPVITPRRSTRNRQQPSWMRTGDYEVGEL